MEVRILAATQIYDDPIHNKKLKDVFEKLSGYSAGVCYLSGTIDTVLAEEERKTLARIKRTLESKHHSVFDHSSITLYLGGIPKAFAMLLNNERFMTTSEKSARYTNMKLEGRQAELYDKWKAIVRERIDEVYRDSVPFLADKKDKLAQENARYFSGVFNPNTSMVHTLSFRQLNYICSWIHNTMAEEKPPLFYKLMFPVMKEFCDKIEDMGLIEPLLTDGKGWGLSLIDDKKVPDVFSPGVFCTTYLSSLAALAQKHRSRTEEYSMSIPEDFSCYIPPIIKSSPNSDLKEEWVEDMISVEKIFPQGMNVSITERGSPKNLIKKADERICTYAQLETSEQTRRTLREYVEKMTPVDQELTDTLNRYIKGCRATAGKFECKNPCMWKEGREGARLI